MFIAHRTHFEHLLFECTIVFVSKISCVKVLNMNRKKGEGDSPVAKRTSPKSKYLNEILETDMFPNSTKYCV